MVNIFTFMEISISKPDWDSRLTQLLSSHDLFAPVSGQSNLDYLLMEADRIPDIVYNQAKPVSPLKTFFLPVKEIERTRCRVYAL